MWWLYFHIGQERARRYRALQRSGADGAHRLHLRTHPDHRRHRGKRVAAELVIVHPDDRAGVGATASVLGGPALFLLGNIWFKKLNYRCMPLSHLVGLGLTAAAFLAHPWLSLIELSALSIAILIVVAVWERVSVGGGLRETTGKPPA